MATWSGLSNDAAVRSKMASSKFKEIGNNGLIWLEELKKARVAAKLGEMSPEELARAKQAWEDGIKAVDKCELRNA